MFPILLEFLFPFFSTALVGMAMADGVPSSSYGAPNGGFSNGNGFGGSNGSPSNGYSAPNGNGQSNGNGAPSNGYSAPNGNGNGRSNGNGAPSNGYRAPNGNGNGNGRSNGNGFGGAIRSPSNGYGAPSNGYGVDPEIAALTENIPGGGVPGEDFPVLASIPDTGFSCDAQAVPGYYADTAPEAGCQVFHICQDRALRRQQDSFLCPNGTIFNQQYLVCDWWFNFDCSTAEDFYSVNELIGLDPNAGYGNRNGNGNGNGNNGYNGSNGNGNNRKNGNGFNSFGSNGNGVNRHSSNGIGGNGNGAPGAPSTSYGAPF